MKNIPYIIIFTLSIEVLIFVAIYAYKRRELLDEMHGMMVGMTLGMVSGLISATLYLIPTGNFLNGVIIGSIVGLLFGMPLGKLGGHLGIMEGVVAGPMGGMMGAMLGQMIRPFSIEVFIPFLMFIFLLTMVSITRVISDKFTMIWIPTISLLLILSIIMPFSISSQSASGSFVSDKNSQETLVSGNLQTIDLEVNSAGSYSPSTIIAKEGIPLKINFSAKIKSCASEIVFPDLGIDVIAPEKGAKTIEIKELKKGTYVFRCPMDMTRGKLIVK